MNELKSTVSHLNSAVSTLQSQFSALTSEISSLQSQWSAVSAPSTNTTAHLASPSEPVSSNRSSLPHNSGLSTPRNGSRSPTLNDGSKYNLVFFGVPECPKGISYQDRISSDHSSVLRVLESASSTLSTSSLRDCLRLGKYKEDTSSPRPLLVKFNGIRDVQFILSNKTKLVMDSGSKIFVRKDLPKEERRTESLLLKERRTLLGEGIQSSRIRIKGSQLFVDAKPFGQVRSSVFTKNPNFEAESQPMNSSSQVNSVSPGGSTDVDSPPED